MPPKRDDEIYKEIEEFKDYEYTYCIAYEMMKRNKEYQKELKFWNENCRVSAMGDNLPLHNKKCKFYFKYGFASIFDFLLREEKDSTKVQYSFKNRDTQVLIDNNNISLLTKDRILPKEISKNELSLYKGNFREKIISLGFSRKKLVFEENTLIDINLSLPKNELIAYISELKDAYDADKLNLKTPTELKKTEINFTDDTELTKQQKMADMFFVYDYFENSTDKLSYTKIQKIKEELTKYYGYKIRDTKKTKIVSYDVYQKLKEDDIYKNKDVLYFYEETTIKNLLKQAKNYIDDMGYKKLVS